ncbi:DUF3986 family protein [Parageobacillus toebii]
MVINCREWISVKFDPNQHLHLGYYENNVDLEAVAYKIQNENKWVVF